MPVFFLKKSSLLIAFPMPASKTPQSSAQIKEKASMSRRSSDAVVSKAKLWCRNSVLEGRPCSMTLTVIILKLEPLVHSALCDLGLTISREESERLQLLGHGLERHQKRRNSLQYVVSCALGRCPLQNRDQLSSILPKKVRCLSTIVQLQCAWDLFCICAVTVSLPLRGGLC